jgi:hypothetical protein
MQELEGCLHPGKGIRSFMNEFRRRKNMELIVITNPNTFRMAGLSAAVQDDLPLFRFWLTADQDGEIEVYKNQKNSRKHHQRFKLPLEELWSQRRPKQKRAVPHKEIPESTYPILFPGSPNRRNFILAPDGTPFVIGRDRCVYRVTLIQPGQGYEARKGWEMLHESMLYGAGKKAMGQNDQGEYILLTYSQQVRRGMVLNLQTKEKYEFPFAPDYHYLWPEFVFYNGAFHLRTRSHIHMISVKGELSQQQVGESAPAVHLFGEAYTDYQKQVKEAELRLPPGENYLHKIHTMGISDDGHLVVNKHKLVVRDHGLVWIPNEVKTLKYTTSRSNDRFSFRLRYAIQNTGSGMLVFTDTEGDTVYIPLALEQPVAIATAHKFAGSPYYKRSELKAQQNITVPEFMKEHMEAFFKSFE